jgi:hypothetical protein
MAKTLHVYRSNGAWAVKKEGRRPETFGTKREAVQVAVQDGKKAKTAQVVVHGKDGRILEYRTYGMPKIQEPPKRGRLAYRRIASAVGQVVLDRLHGDPLPSRADAPTQ